MKKTIICGKNSVIDAINSNLSIRKIYLLKPFSFSKSINYEIITREEMDKITNLNHQGFIAILEEEFNYYPIDQMIRNKPNIILILDHIEDPHNLGAIIRTANACGVSNIIIPKDRAAQVNSTVLKVSSGGIVNMKIAKSNSLQSTIDKLKKNNYWIYATSISNGVAYDKVTYNFPLTIIIGNEGKGVSSTLLKQSDQNLFIPMRGTVQSLNVSVATGIILFEIMKKN